MIPSSIIRGGIVAVLAATLLAGCHKKPPGMGGDMMGGGANGEENANTQAYGMPSQQGGFSDQGGATYGQRHVNAHTAPANQVYYFEFDQDGVQSSDITDMNTQATYIAAHPSAHIRLEGNTDNRGSREYNVGLGYRRAQAVARVLEQQGVLPKQINIVSYGKEHPAADGDNEQAWSLNRRVELIYESQ